MARITCLGLKKIKLFEFFDVASEGSYIKRLLFFVEKKMKIGVFYCIKCGKRDLLEYFA